MVGGPKVNIVSVRVLYVFFTQVYAGWDANKSFPVVGGWSQSDYSVCPRPLLLVYSGILRYSFVVYKGLQKVFRWWWVVVPK